MTKTTPGNKVGYFTKLDPALRKIMADHKSATGIPEAQMIDRALRAWFAALGIEARAGRVARGGAKKK